MWNWVWGAGVPRRGGSRRSEHVETVRGTSLDMRGSRVGGDLPHIILDMGLEMDWGVGKMISITMGLIFKS